jgi:hypothetical protein
MPQGAEALEEFFPQNSLKPAVHKVCVPNLHIAHFWKVKDDANPTVRQLLVWHPSCGNALRSVQSKSSPVKHKAEQPSRAIMSRQAAEVGLPESEYLTVPEIAKILRRNRKTVYGWIESGGIGEVDGLFVVQGRYLIHWPTFRTRQFKPRVR